jgi:hypothetical protein
MKGMRHTSCSRVFGLKEAFPLDDNPSELETG